MTKYGLVPHNKRTKFILTNGESNKEEYSIYADSKKGNQDPYIWNKNFVYSFCHANGFINKFEKGDYLFFLSPNSKGWKSATKFYIDTVINVEKIIEWPEKNKRKQNDLYPYFEKEGFKINDCLWKDHFQYPSMGQHNNKKLFTIIGDSDKSYVPFHNRPFEDNDFKILKNLINRKSNNYDDWEYNKNWNMYPTVLDDDIKNIVCKNLSKNKDILFGKTLGKLINNRKK